MAMWEARHKTRWQNLQHEAAQVFRQARTDRRFLARDFSRLVLGGYESRDRFTRLVSRFQPRTPGFVASEAAKSLRDALLGPGYTQPLGLVTPGELAEIRDYLLAKTYADPYRPHLGSFRYPDTPAPESNQGYYNIETVLKAPHVLRLLNSPLVLETAELILGCKPVLDNITCWWAFSGRSERKGVQRFHRDFDTPRFFKIFLYLTDVEDLTDAHVFVPGSQRSDRLRLTRYIDDDEVESAFGQNGPTPIVGPAGTVFLEDTYGIHRAALPRVQHRLILSAQYNIWPSPFAPRKPPLRLENHDFDPWINRVLLA